MVKKLSDEQFNIEYEKACGSCSAMARNTGLTIRALNYRRNRMVSSGRTKEISSYTWAYPKEQRLDFQDGVGIVFSDPHWWPSKIGTSAHRALLALCRRLKPVVVVANGDLIDGTKISRFPPQGWSKVPSVVEEMGEMQLRLSEIKKAYKGAKLYRTIGNHDLRFDRFIATNAESFDGMHGTRLSDHLPDWPGSWIVRINDTYIKHRFRGGIHAGYNNVLNAGVSIVTGHLHQIGAKPLRGYREGHVWGVETGTTADCPIDTDSAGYGPFEYGEGNPNNWSSGFAILTWHKGALQPPEFCVIDRGRAVFRGSEVMI